ncbi:MAG: hypothetical protein WAW17_27340 [Rhodococcus sp. (in: high G+C Gram-positive bacteria)]
MTATGSHTCRQSNGLPAHVLLVHFVVVLAPLTAILLILCALWPAARRRMVWLIRALAGDQGGCC